VHLGMRTVRFAGEPVGGEPVAELELTIISGFSTVSTALENCPPRARKDPGSAAAWRGMPFTFGVGAGTALPLSTSRGCKPIRLLITWLAPRLNTQAGAPKDQGKSKRARHLIKIKWRIACCSCPWFRRVHEGCPGPGWEPSRVMHPENWTNVQPRGLGWVSRSKNLKVIFVVLQPDTAQNVSFHREFPC